MVTQLCEELRERKVSPKGLKQEAAWKIGTEKMAVWVREMASLAVMEVWMDINPTPNL